jgi:hyaluronan synthase
MEGRVGSVPRGHRGSGRRDPHPFDQAEGLQSLVNIADEDWTRYLRDGEYEPRRTERNRDRGRRVRRSYGRVRARGQALLAPREVTPGALRDCYDIPVVTFNRKDARGLFLTGIVVAAWISYHLGWQSLALLACAAPGAAFRATSYVLSWFDRPAKALPESTRRLDRLHVTVAVPVYNEDASLLDRCIYAMMNQTRPPQLIWVVDDGSKTDYSALVDYWVGTWSNGTEIRWTRQHNQGKRRAHAHVFERVPETDIFITVDSDTTIEYRAIEEGLKPFQDSRVQSVAGIEMGFNAYQNFLTRLQCSLQLYAQAVIGAAWSVVGDMYTNRGPYALYRAELIRKYLAVYRDEMFFGRRVILGDDSLLALCGSTEGRSVQQLTAIGLTMWPETLGHHLRQRLRWARGRAVRNFWRIKYRPFLSYCWWVTVTGIQGFLTSLALVTLLIMTWPLGEPVLVRTTIAMLILSVPNGLRTLCYKRSDETLKDRVGLVLIRPLSAVWSGIVLSRGLRTWGTMTLLKQGWTTRQKGAELTFSPAGSGEPAPEPVSSGTFAA